MEKSCAAWEGENSRAASRRKIGVEYFLKVFPSFLLPILLFHIGTLYTPHKSFHHIALFYSPIICAQTVYDTQEIHRRLILD